MIRLVACAPAAGGACLVHPPARILLHRRTGSIPAQCRKEPRMLTTEEEIVISVSAYQVVICRHRELPNGTIACDCATNAEDLENAALVNHRPIVPTHCRQYCQF